MTLDEAYELLTTNPKALLESAYILCAGGKEDSTSKLAIFSMKRNVSSENAWRKPGEIKGLPAFLISYMPDKMVHPVKGSEAGEEFRTFSAYYVAMKKMREAGHEGPSGTAIVLPTSGGADLCITSQLTGCSFGIGSQAPGGSCLVSHIRPLVNAATNQEAMTAQTRHLVGDPLHTVVAMGDQYSERATVIGRRVDGQWKFFVQKHKAGFNQLIEGVLEL